MTDAEIDSLRVMLQEAIYQEISEMSSPASGYPEYTHGLINRVSDVVKARLTILDELMPPGAVTDDEWQYFDDLFS